MSKFFFAKISRTNTKEYNANVKNADLYKKVKNKE